MYAIRSSAYDSARQNEQYLLRACSIIYSEYNVCIVMRIHSSVSSPTAHNLALFSVVDFRPPMPYHTYDSKS